jgi:hypothetical protein
MHLFLALVYLDRLTDRDCPELEFYQLDYAIEKLLRIMPAEDVGYFEAILHVCKWAQQQQ